MTENSKLVGLLDAYAAKPSVVQAWRDLFAEAGKMIRSQASRIAELEAAAGAPNYQPVGSAFTIHELLALEAQGMTLTDAEAKAISEFRAANPDNSGESPC